MKGLVSAVAMATVLAVAAAACSSSDSPTATPTTTLGADDVASVNGVGLKRADFDADMKDYSANSLFMQTGQGGDSNTTVSADFRLKTLQADIIFELVQQEVARRNLPPASRPPRPTPRACPSASADSAAPSASPDGPARSSSR